VALDAHREVDPLVDVQHDCQRKEERGYRRKDGSFARVRQAHISWRGWGQPRVSTLVNEEKSLA